MVCTGLVLAGCASPFTTDDNILDLLKAPALGQNQDVIQNALAEYLKKNEKVPTYVYPKSPGEDKNNTYTSPLILADFDGDGKDEAILLYTVKNDPNRANVMLALLVQEDSGWQVKVEADGGGTDVSSVDVIDMLEDGTKQIIIGFTSATDKVYQMYQYDDVQETLVLNFSGRYQRYLIDNFTGSETQDIVFVLPSSPESQLPLQLEFLTATDGTYNEVEKLSLHRNFTTCLSLKPSIGKNKEHLLVVDGLLNTVNKTSIATQFFYYSEEEGKFTPYFNDESFIIKETTRSSTLLLSNDINKDEIVEVPIIDPEVTQPDDSRYSFITWKNFYPENNVENVQYGILDTENGYYISIPETWHGNVRLEADENKMQWKLFNATTGSLLLSMETRSSDNVPTEDERYLKLGPKGYNKLYLIYGSAVKDIDKKQVKAVSLG